ncbi:hypothetical protein GGR55DRAFT_663464 [Xylaria sp. FL0064]|nr:hypothetical protein GGR55DRAFT_663464 [Xylaria sp. FL0064]
MARWHLPKLPSYTQTTFCCRLSISLVSLSPRHQPVLVGLITRPCSYVPFCYAYICCRRTLPIIQPTASSCPLVHLLLVSFLFAFFPPSLPFHPSSTYFAPLSSLLSSSLTFLASCHRDHLSVLFSTYQSWLRPTYPKMESVHPTQVPLVAFNNITIWLGSSAPEKEPSR